MAKLDNYDKAEFDELCMDTLLKAGSFDPRGIASIRKTQPTR